MFDEVAVCSSDSAWRSCSCVFMTMAIPRHRLFDRFTRYQQKGDAFITGLNDDHIPVVE
jgi:hypothetical protein